MSPKVCHFDVQSKRNTSKFSCPPLVATSLWSLTLSLGHRERLLWCSVWLREFPGMQWLWGLSDLEGLITERNLKVHWTLSTGEFWLKPFSFCLIHFSQKHHVLPPQSYRTATFSTVVFLFLYGGHFHLNYFRFQFTSILWTLYKCVCFLSLCCMLFVCPLSVYFDKCKDLNLPIHDGWFSFPSTKSIKARKRENASPLSSF